MSNKDYYGRWLALKEEFKTALAEDERLQELAIAEIGIKPQATAVEIVARVYSKYCQLYNQLCDCYDQMEQVQRRPYIKKIIDAITCRILELKLSLEEVEVLEYTYPDNALVQMLIKPDDIQIVCPFFYPFEIRQAEMQHIMDEILAGNRLGDPTPTASEIEQREEERLEQERELKEAKEAEIKRKLAMGEDITESEPSVIMSPEEMEELRLQQEYIGHVNTIQRMERTRYIVKEKVHKQNQDANLYLELAGLKVPPAREELRIKAACLIERVCRRFQEIKRKHIYDRKLNEKLGLVVSSWSPPSAKIQLEKVKAERRKFRREYYEKYLEANLKEKSRVFKLREGNIMEDISDEIKQWFKEWYAEERIFDEFPWPEEGGSILIVRGETFSIEEYLEWRTAEEKRLKAEAGSPKSKEEIKAEKIAAREEKKRLEMEAREREKKRLLDYKKSRLNPDNDPGIHIKIGRTIDSLKSEWGSYENLWKYIDEKDPPLDVIKGFITKLLTEDAYQSAQLQLRPIVDEMMKLELVVLRNALKADYAMAGVQKLPLIKKRKKPKKPKVVKPDKIKPAVMFQELVDEGIVRKYPRKTLEEYWGDRNYAAADTRAVLWTPTFPPHCVGDVREQVRIRCVLTLGSECSNAVRTQLIVGPKGAGKRTLAYAVATETNALLIDLSPFNVYNKFPGKGLKKMFLYVNKISRLMQPTVILIDNAEKMFYKKVPKEEKMFDPTRLSKDIYKEIIKPISGSDKILVIGTATEPWLAKGPAMSKIFPSLIMIPRSDYGSISFILTQMLMKFHNVKRDFNVHSVAQALRGYDLNSVRQGVEKLLSGDRLVQLKQKPLEPMEVVSSVLDLEGSAYFDPFDYQMFQDWYLSYSPWGEKYLDYMMMLESQLNYKIKNEKKGAF